MYDSMIYLIGAASIASCERNFSKASVIKSYLKSTIGENRLPALAIGYLLSIGSDLVATLSFDRIISEFASMKA